jgi:hypothetical protein
MTTADAWLVQILLPLTDNERRPFADAVWDRLKARLVDAFGGVTAYQHTPAQGVWAPTQQARTREEVFVVEVMTAEFDVGWWTELQGDLERELRQEAIVVRALRTTELNPVARQGA